MQFKKMKTILNKLFSLGVALVLVSSCTSDETKVTFTGGTAPTLSVSNSSDLTLAKANESFSSLQFQWTNPNYQFSNGVSTQDVYYTLQIDTTGSGFTNPKMGTISLTNDVFHSFTVKDLNNALATLELKDYVFHPFEFRIKATMASSSEPLYSNVLKINIATYLDVLYPVPDHLYITGSATPAGWQSGSGTEAVPPDQEFVKDNSYSFHIDNLALTYTGTGDSDNGYLLLPVYSSWNAKYGFTGAKHANNGLSDTFKPDGNDFAPPSVSGNYKITVNFKTGKITLEKL